MSKGSFLSGIKKLNSYWGPIFIEIFTKKKDKEGPSDVVNSHLAIALLWTNLYNNNIRLWSGAYSDYRSIRVAIPPLLLQIVNKPLILQVMDPRITTLYFYFTNS